ncbi:hypothetical protein GCM10028798_28040 [Humibacter antri]
MVVSPSLSPSLSLKRRGDIRIRNAGIRARCRVCDDAAILPHAYAGDIPSDARAAAGGWRPLA